MKRRFSAAGAALLLLLSSAAPAALSDPRIDHIAPDGRFIIYGDLTGVFRAGDKVLVRRDGKNIGAAVVSSIYPSYVTFRTLSLETGAWLEEGDLVRNLGAGAGTIREIQPNLRDPAVDNISPDGALQCYGDLGERGFRNGALVEILRDDAAIAAAEVVEVGTHITTLKLIGAAGAEVRTGDKVRIPPDVSKQLGSLSTAPPAAALTAPQDIEHKKQSGETSGKAEKKIEKSTKAKKEIEDPIEKKIWETKK
ncbi:MAG: hypothetical protein AB1742_13825 [bacterium]